MVLNSWDLLGLEGSVFCSEQECLIPVTDNVRLTMCIEPQCKNYILTPSADAGAQNNKCIPLGSKKHPKSFFEG